MFWDIVIAVGIAATQLFLCWYALHVSEKENRLRNGLVVGTVGFVGILLTVFFTVRATKSQTRLEKEVEEIQAKLENPPTIVVKPPSVTVTPPPTKHRAVMHFAEPKTNFELDKPMVVSLNCQTVSDFPAKDVTCASQFFTVRLNEKGEVEVSTQDTVIGTFNKASATLVSDKRKPSIAKGDGVGGDSYGPLYTKEMDNALNIEKTQTIIELGRLTFSDEVGPHEMDFCAWVQPPVNGVPRKWHYCHDFNGEQSGRK